MRQARRWYGDWGHLLFGMFIGLLIVTPAFAAPPDLPLRFDDDARLYTLIASGVLLFIALVMRSLRNRSAPTDESEPESRGYGMRFFPSDRPIALE